MDLAPDRPLAGPSQQWFGAPLAARELQWLARSLARSLFCARPPSISSQIAPLVARQPNETKLWRATSGAIVLSPARGRGGGGGSCVQYHPGEFWRPICLLLSF